MRYLWGILFLLTISGQAETTLRSGPQRVSLLEVYTSEGCSSCPPAETWLSGFKTDNRLWKEIVPIAFHVDYWDDLGWKDRFAKREYTARQRAYSSSWETSSIYTPGFVLDGLEWKGWFDGVPLPTPSDRSAGMLEARFEDKMAMITFSESSGAKEIEAHLVPLAMDVNSDVRAGENRGRKLVHSFVALDLVSEKVSGKNGVFAVELPFDYASARAVAVWVTVDGSAKPIQAAGGYLK